METEKRKLKRDVEMSEEQSYIEDEKEMSLDYKQSKKRTRREHLSNEPSAPPEAQSDSEERSRDGKKKTRQ